MHGRLLSKIVCPWLHVMRLTSQVAQAWRSRVPLNRSIWATWRSKLVRWRGGGVSPPHVCVCVCVCACPHGPRVFLSVSFHVSVICITISVYICCWGYTRHPPLTPIGRCCGLCEGLFQTSHTQPLAQKINPFLQCQPSTPASLLCKCSMLGLVHGALRKRPRISKQTV